jgi:hypothetical protein
MTFKIKAPETIPAELVFKGQGREQTLKLVYRFTERTKYLQLLDAIGKSEVKAEDGVLQLVESWEADMDLSAEAVRLLDEQQPGVLVNIVFGYGEAAAVARKGN